jgi:hypothetical protein
VIHESSLDFAFAPRIGGSKEVKQVRILKYMCCHIRLHRWRSRFEIADGLPMPLVCTTFDLEYEDSLAPAMFSSLTGVPEIEPASV